MSEVAVFKPYGFGDRVYVVLASIVWFEPYSSNNNSGTKLHLVDDVELLIGDSPADVTRAIDGVALSSSNTEHPRPAVKRPLPPTPPPCRIVKGPFL
ncbi:hypothetical protein L2703_13840 [Shewanella basaltis]|uniref:hypothetical protein n=1 Tax=Shewanella basaltis TaxID=472183 RepID=UPI00200D0FDF|nr:hypothetical protein [Shewanella basaltis]MCL1114669.1 hypothetical protein [Shewanella basaltis]